jgi:hypothetical protein
MPVLALPGHGQPGRRSAVLAGIRGPPGGVAPALASFSDSATMRLYVSLESRSVTRISRTTGQAATKTLLLVVDVSPVVMAIWSLLAI